MIADEIVREICLLLSEGCLSQRTIARRMGVSRGTVCAVARGKRTEDFSRIRAAGIHFSHPAGRAVRCPDCGGLVQMPCLACYLRRSRRRTHGAA